MDRKFYKIQKYIPNFSVNISENKLIVNFEKGVLAKIFDTNRKANILEININKQTATSSLIDGEHIGYLFNLQLKDNQIYTLADALRDSFFILLGYDAEFVNHNNISDIEYLDSIKKDIPILDVPEFNVIFNHQTNRVKKPNKPRYYTPSVIHTPYGSVVSKKKTKNINSDIEDNEPYLYITFKNPVKVYTKNLQGIEYINCAKFGIHIENQNDLCNNFSIFSYNDYLEKGLCIFNRLSICGSFFDLYDIFDLLNIFLKSVKNEIGYNYKYSYKTIESEDDVFLVEL